eukprot:2731629-Heterocapsa_arctica.AAC.1
MLIKAGQRVIELSKGVSNKTPAQKLFWLSKARFAVRTRCCNYLRRALEAILDFSHLFDPLVPSVSDPCGLCSCIAELHVLDIKAQISELELSSLKDEEKSQKSSRLHS